MFNSKDEKDEDSYELSLNSLTFYNNSNIVYVLEKGYFR